MVFVAKISPTAVVGREPGRMIAVGALIKIGARTVPTAGMTTDAHTAVVGILMVFITARKGREKDQEVHKIRTKRTAIAVQRKSSIE